MDVIAITYTSDYLSSMHNLYDVDKALQLIRDAKYILKFNFLAYRQPSPSEDVVFLHITRTSSGIKVFHNCPNLTFALNLINTQIPCLVESFDEENEAYEEIYEEFSEDEYEEDYVDDYVDEEDEDTAF